MKKLHISTQKKMIFGVCSGLSESFGLEVNVIRIVFFISLFFGGTGLLIYLILYAILPRDYSSEKIIDVEVKEDEEDTEKDHKILRSRTDSMIAGVCGGLSNYLKWDVSIIRLTFIGMTFVGGVGIILYLFFWFIFPLED